MSTAPLLVALQNQDVLQRISLELNAVGRDFTIVTNSSELVQSISGATDVIVDAQCAPDGQEPGSFLAAVASRARGGRVLALSQAPGADGYLSDEALLDLGASDVFGVQTSARVVVARLGSARPTLGGPGAASNVTLPELMLVEGVAAREGMHGENGGLQSILASSLNEDCEPAGVLPAEALEGFTERVAVRLTRARDRERTVAIFCASVRGLNVPNPKREIQGLLETVLEELDSTQEMSYSASRLAVVAMGDDLYAILVPDIERVQDAARLGVRLHEAVSTTSGVMAHIGIACSPDDGTGASELIEHAQDAVLRARQAGENNIEFYSESMSRWAFERLTLEQSLRDALRNRELVVYYQPRIDIETRKILGMEALVRWIHPQFGLVSPGQFIPLAEETGLIIPIGEWILRDACRQNAAWRAMGLPPIRVSVNLSPVQFRKPNLHESVYDALDDAGLEADGLELEVTESLLMNDPAETASILGKLKSRGIHISIDDFGTGYSSLSYLKRFPINALKIDRSFITDVTTNPDDAAITTAIILMGHSLKLSVVAEGVETENQLAFLKVLQCNEVQGFLFSPPVPAERAQEMLADQQFAKAAA
ncbi:MAG: EAL domain-containing protein (putative c-di-GMP-specific phosphodiesterase class I) [Planctomycetota bacterium]|jgi:EAL domain-containing protein (putative c-di-GMP-specific phosphodiesterase class I)